MMRVRYLVWAVGLGVVGALGMATETLAQNTITPDETLGLNRSVINFTDNAPLDIVVEGGATRGQNLLHSFTEFNINEGQGVHFFSPSPEIQTIFSRVTGTNQSSILGTLGTSGNSEPDLWLINPNGILFGPDASLDLGGSFFATTADAIEIEGSRVFADSQVPTDAQILTIGNAVLFLDILSDAQIINQSRANRYAIDSPLNGPENFEGLQVAAGNNISFLGQNISFNNGVLNVPDGNISLFSTNFIGFENGSSVRGGGDVVAESSQGDGSRGFSGDDGSRGFSGDDGSRGFSGGYGSHNFSEQNISFDNDVLDVPNGNIFLSSTNSIKLDNGSSVVGGNVVVESNQISVRDGSRLLSQLIDTERLGVSSVQTVFEKVIVSDLDGLQELPTVSGGNILVNARESVEITGTSLDEQSPSLIGSDAIGLLSSGGNVEIQTPSLTVQGGGQVSSSYISFSNQNVGGGRISVEEADSVIVTGESLNGEHPSRLYIGDSPFLSENFSPSSPSDGSILLQTEQFSLLNGAEIGARGISQNIEPQVIQLTSSAIEILASNTIIGGLSPTEAPANITAIFDDSNQEGILSSGSNQRSSAQRGFDPNRISDGSSIFEQKDIPGIPIFVTSDSIDIQQSGRIIGDVSLQGENITIRDNAAISGNVVSVLGGNIIVRDQAEVKVDELALIFRNNGEQVSNTSINLRGENIAIQDDAQIVGDSSLQGKFIVIQNDASVNGSIVSFSGERISLEDQSEVRADEPDFGDGGRVDITTNFLSLQDSAQLSANVANTGNGGTVRIVTYDSVEGIGKVELIGDPKSSNPSSISATVGGPGNGGVFQ